jgi:hypothetical protein
MDSIERIFGVSPDGGSGAFEGLLFLLAVLGLFLLYKSASLWKRRKG